MAVGSKSPIATNIFDFERDFDDKYWVTWMQQKGFSIAVVASVVYVVVIFGVQGWMKTRDRFELRGALIAWNVILAVFSIIGCWRMLIALINIFHHGDSWHQAICDANNYSNTTVSGFWLWACTMSKLLELGDTLFVVLRKSKLIFLHWYHHVVTLLNVWWGYGGRISVAFLFTLMNLFIHAIMYSYYALRAGHVKVPRAGAMVITGLQLSQMGLGVWLCYYVYQVQSHGQSCDVSEWQWWASVLMYISYFILFGNFFYHTYLKKQPKRDGKKKQ